MKALISTSPNDARGFITDKKAIALWRKWDSLAEKVAFERYSIPATHAAMVMAGRKFAAHVGREYPKHVDGCKCEACVHG